MQQVTGRTPVRLGPRGRVVFDVVLMLALALPSLAAVRYTNGWAIVFSLAETVPLVLRRRRPTLVFALVAGASGVQALAYDYPVWGQVGFPVALYSLVRYAEPAWLGRLGLVVGLVGSVVATSVWTRSLNAATPPEVRDDLTLFSYLPYGVLAATASLAAWALGAQARVRRAYEQALVERGERLALEAEQRALVAATDERARIAREMHDVVAHGLSVVIVQADGARYAAEQDPQVAVRTLATIAQTGRDALGEMRRLLGLLRGTTDPELVPQPGLADLTGLLADTGGIPVEASLPDPLPQVPDGVALTVYRVVQESLTNVRKHAGPGARAVVRLAEEPGVLVVEVVDDGRGAAAAGGSGLGLLGMRERVDVHGGTLETGPVPGGWRVSARIPT
ncbi:MAG: histidine kinase [Aeromicrobium erythreum]